MQKKYELTNHQFRWCLRFFLIFLVVAFGAAFWQGRLMLSAAWVPGHPSHDLYVFLGYVKTWGSLGYWVLGIASIVLFIRRRSRRQAASREREEERVRARDE